MTTEERGEDRVCDVTLAEGNQVQLSGYIDTEEKQTQTESLSYDFSQCHPHIEVLTPHSPGARFVTNYKDGWMDGWRWVHLNFPASLVTADQRGISDDLRHKLYFWN